MSCLPLFTVLFLCALILVWNFSFYEVHGAYESGGSEEQHAAGGSAVADLSGGDGAQAVDHTDRIRVHVPVAALAGSAVDSVPPTVDPRSSSREVGAPPGARRKAGAASALPEGHRAAAGRQVHEVVYYPSGAKRAEGLREDDLRVGSWTEWWENGEVKREGRYEADRPHGEWSSWHESGALERQGSFDSGERVGPWRTWHEEGRLLMG